LRLPCICINARSARGRVDMDVSEPLSVRQFQRPEWFKIKWWGGAKKTKQEFFECNEGSRAAPAIDRLP
jgi:hypothetical protein